MKFDLSPNFARREKFYEKIFPENGLFGFQISFYIDLVSGTYKIKRTV